MNSKVSVFFRLFLHLMFFGSITNCLYAVPSDEPFTDPAGLESEVLRLRAQLQDKLSTMGLDSLEIGIDRVKGIRQARTELLGLQADQSVWEALHTKLQPLNTLESEDLYLWPNQTYEMDCKGILLARAVFRNDALFWDLERIVVSRFSDMEYVEQVLFNLFWWDPH
ncbi:MAG: hypothetical protein HON43_00365 [Alphaproteobacteria bacterium]|jgi:hypothetical protein|nr:hypothetical protein [Alphaproteobacteria bacterium]MBT5389465.1 hypothetical protein [Alphaproteobacteria bacterium]